MTKFTLIFTLILFLGPLTHATGEDAGKEFSDSISDVDYSHLNAAPIMNWGLSPFSRKPGYITIDPQLDQVSVEQFKLGGIIFDKYDPVAVINGETVGVGDMVGGLKVEVIKPNYVIISGDGNRFELSLGLPKDAEQSAEIRPLRQPSGELEP